jgi:uncharacterized protein (UPF0332 family)
MRRAGQALKEAEALLDLNFAQGASNRIYYAAFHAARAALSVKERASRTHAGQIKLFEETFGSAPALTRLLQQRVAADYGTEPYEPSTDDVRSLLDESAEFVERCRTIVAEASAQGPTAEDPAPDL